MRFISKKGFTLVEIMIVIAIIGIFFVAVQQFASNRNIDQERAQRLAEVISDLISSTHNDMVIGRGVFTGSASSLDIIPTAEKRIVFNLSPLDFSLQYKASTGGTGTEQSWGIGQG
jgi:prepilin-type N-terminal cleavage/methylation domain-containing protein